MFIFPKKCWEESRKFFDTYYIYNLHTHIYCCLTFVCAIWKKNIVILVFWKPICNQIIPVKKSASWQRNDVKRQRLCKNMKDDTEVLHSFLFVGQGYRLFSRYESYIHTLGLGLTCVSLLWCDLSNLLFLRSSKLSGLLLCWTGFLFQVLLWCISILSSLMLNYSRDPLLGLLIWWFVVVLFSIFFLIQQLNPLNIFN